MSLIVLCDYWLLFTKCSFNFVRGWIVNVPTFAHWCHFLTGLMNNSRTQCQGHHWQVNAKISLSRRFMMLPTKFIHWKEISSFFLPNVDWKWCWNFKTSCSYQRSVQEQHKVDFENNKCMLTLWTGTKTQTPRLPSIRKFMYQV